MRKGKAFLNRESRLHTAKALCSSLAPMSQSWDELRQMAHEYVDEAVADMEHSDGGLTHDLLRDVSMLAAKAEAEGQESLSAIFAIVAAAIANEDSEGLYPHMSRYVQTDLPYRARKSLAEILAEDSEGDASSSIM